MTKFYAQEKRVFDINKVTVVGNPTITSDGVASGFSANDYLRLPEVFNTDREFEIILKARTPKTTPTSSQYILSYLTNGYGMGLFVSTSSKIAWAIHRDASSYDESIIGKTLELDTDYLFKLSYKNNIYSLDVSKDGITWINQGTKQSGVPLNDSASYTRIGVNASYNVTGIYTGSINLNSFKIYVDNQLIYSPTKPICYLERRKHKVWNKGQFTVVGNPSISESGIASGFSAGNSVEIPLSITSNKFTIEGEFSFGNNLTTFQYACDVFSPAINRYIISIRPVSDNSLAVCYWNGTGTEVVFYSQTEVPRIANKSYKYKIEIDGTTAKSTINGITKTTNKFVFSDVTKIILGSNYVGDGLFYGSINLKQFKIYTDNNLVFDGGAETYVYDPSKFTVVGTPTINEYGVASGFSSVNNIELPYLMPTPAKSLNIKIKFNINDIATGERSLFGQLLVPHSGFQINILANNALKWVASNTSQGDIFSRVVPNFNLSNGDYLLEIVWDGATYKLIINGEIKDSWDSTVAVINYNVYCLGNRGNLSVPFTIGSIDLTQFSITVDGKEVFTGAKEKYYAMQGGI